MMIFQAWFESSRLLGEDMGKQKYRSDILRRHILMRANKSDIYNLILF